MTIRAEAAARAPGALLHGAGKYDVLVWLLTFGRERAFREKLLGFARLSPGERVLDVGCGTGTLALVAKQRGAGRVAGIDASPEMIARAQEKAKKAGLDASFEVAAAQSLPFGDATFDLALSTLMLHHLGREARARCLAELRRVVAPGGRVLVVDFGSRPSKHGLLARFHRRHGAVPLAELTTLIEGAGLEIVDSGPVGFRDLHFVLARTP